MVELVADEFDERRLKFLVWKDSKPHISRQITKKKKRAAQGKSQTVVYVPPEIDPSIRKAMRFPSRVDEFGSSEQLLNEICETILRYTGLSRNAALLASNAVLASWFPEALTSPIGVVICGPPCPQGQQLLRLLSCMYRRALILGEVSLAAFCALPMHFSPSIFIEHYDHTPRMQKVIRAAFSRSYLPSKGKLVPTGSMSVIYSDEPLIGAASCGWNVVEIPAGNIQAPLPFLACDVEDQIARNFQPKLLKYRLTTFHQVMNSMSEGASSGSAIRDLFRGLSACIVGNSDRGTGLMELLKDREQQVIEEISWNPQVTLLEGLLSLCHEDKRQSVHVRDVTVASNRILEERGELLDMTSRAVGSKLRSLGLATSRLDAAGRGFLLTREIRQRIHRLALDNRIEFPHDEKWSCEECTDIRHRETNIGEVDLESREEPVPE
jgi:uncharacterized protein YoaH (UPF0181 family)